jgi:glycine/D-amino acid oxidase-like deaminating enzyme
MNENDDAPATFCLSGVHYIEFLNALHNHVTPRSYLEVGTATGASLSVAGCDTIAVDPQFAVGAGATGNRTRTLFFQMTSDDFFATCWTVRLPAWSRSPGWILIERSCQLLLRDRRSVRRIRSRRGPAEVVLGQTRTNRFATALRATRPPDRAVHPILTQCRATGPTSELAAEGQSNEPLG